MAGIDDIAAERQRQIDAEGWTPEHDDSHIRGEMAAVAALYAAPHRIRVDAELGKALYPPSWGPGWWKPKSRRQDLVRAGALIAAEIDRLDRLNKSER